MKVRPTVPGSPTVGEYSINLEMPFNGQVAYGQDVHLIDVSISNYTIEENENGTFTLSYTISVTYEVEHHDLWQVGDRYIDESGVFWELNSSRMWQQTGERVNDEHPDDTQPPQNNGLVPDAVLSFRDVEALRNLNISVRNMLPLDKNAYRRL